MNENIKQLFEKLRLDLSWGWLQAFREKEKYLPPASGSILELLVAKTIFSEVELGNMESGVSVGGFCRMVKCKDGWLAVNLPRQSDLDLLPAWFETYQFNGLRSKEEVWERLGALAAMRPTVQLNERAGHLGLAVSALEGHLPFKSAEPDSNGLSDGGSLRISFSELTVIDLSALWAGPLIGKLFADAGATVIKLESKERLDGLKRGSLQFYEHLNGAKTLKTINWNAQELCQHLQGASVVIESSRPRVLSHLGVNPKDFVAEGTVWVSVTGYGRVSNRIAYGDDAAVAGGLYLEGKQKEFIGDAIADPITGLDAYIATLKVLEAGKAELLDISMVQAVKDLLKANAS